MTHRDRNLGEAERLQPGKQRGGLDRVIGVALVEVVQVDAGQAVRADKRPARPEHPQRLREHRVLQGARRHVVQHREHPDGVERPVGVVERGRVPRHRADVRPGKARPQRGDGGIVEVKGDHPADPVSQPFGRRARPGADLEQVAAQVNACGGRWQDFFVQVRGPFGGTEQVGVVLVHSM